MRVEWRDEVETSKRVQAVNRQLRTVPQRGIGYGLLRYLGEDSGLRQRLSELPQAEVSFNYLGQFNQSAEPDALFSVASESAGPTRAAVGLRQYVLEIAGGVVDGQLAMSWVYSTNLHREGTVE